MFVFLLTSFLRDRVCVRVCFRFYKIVKNTSDVRTNSIYIMFVFVFVFLFLTFAFSVGSIAPRGGARRGCIHYHAWP